ncbi:MAG: tetratricopeptide repeat protein, partial [Verrucomicrobiota bacterium]
NKLYEQGKYAEAATAYEALIQHTPSSALYFNLGNAYFKKGEPGEAIACYLLARRLDPRDPDIRANLRFARDSVGTRSPKAGRLDRWLALFTMNELTVASAVVVWLWFGLLALAYIRRDWAKSLRSSQVLVGILAALMVIWQAVAMRQRIGAREAVVISKEAVIRYGPFEEAQSFYTLHAGSELVLLNRKGDWLNVSDSASRAGWVQSRQVKVLPPG